MANAPSAFQSWATACTAAPPTNSPTELKRLALAHFQHLSTSNTSSATSKGESTVAQDLSTASSSTPNGALALLVSSLRPVISSSEDAAKVCGLNCLEGALEGCTSLTHGVRHAVGNFLVELCRVGENEFDTRKHAFVDDDGLTSEEITAKLQAMEREYGTTARGSSSDEVRDAAVACLTTLLQSNLDVFPTQQSKSKAGGNSLTEALSVLHESMEMRLDLAMKGINYRCNNDSVVSERTMNAGDGYELEEEFGMEAVLSQLPRAKRSLCFTLLGNALDGFNHDVVRQNSLASDLSAVPTSVRKTMSKFASLTASCLHGETDPRCLMQLLLLLNKIQQVMLPLYNNTTTFDDEHNMESNGNHIGFPSTEIFDAVAPYYPVHFTPPKNDPHKITQDVLHTALMAVLCEDGVAIESSGVEDGDENMIIHTARMFIERLDPMKSTDYQPPSQGTTSDEEDKLDAVRDLSILLLGKTKHKHDLDKHGVNKNKMLVVSSNITRASPSLLSELSSTLSRVHEDAVSSNTSDTMKSLATSIRQLSSSLAYSLELLVITTGNDKSKSEVSLWEAFVVNTITRLSPPLESSPQGIHGRACTAYLASLAACGGIETLNKVLEACMPRFLASSTFDNTTIAAIRGIAALMSSCRVAMDRWEGENDGVRVHPHPLTAYLSGIVQMISIVFDARSNERDEPFLLAVVTALESLLTSSDLSILGDDHIVQLVKIFSWIAGVIFEGENGHEMEGINELKLSCARTIGMFIATTLQDDHNEPTGSKLSTLAVELLPQVLNSVMSHTPPSNSQPYQNDWITLLTICTNGTEQMAYNILNGLLIKAVDILNDSQTECVPLIVFSFICRNGGSNVSKACTVLASPENTIFDVINALCKSPVSESETRGELSSGISQLKLPVVITKEEETWKSDVDAQIYYASTILPLLIPAFECQAAGVSFEGLVELLNQVLPPLSRWDEVKLCVIIPLLAVVLSNSRDIKELLDSLPAQGLESMVRHLVDFVISSQHETNSRASAASCLFSIVLNTENELTMSYIISDTVCRALVEYLEALHSGTNKNMEFCRAQDIFNLMGHWGSIAACKAGAHSTYADEVASFLVQMACNGSSFFPLLESRVKCILPENISVLPAISYGSMLSVYNGSPFWRQRIIFKTIPIVLSRIQEELQSKNPPSLGPLTICSILCCLPSSLLGEDNTNQMVSMVIAGLVHLTKNIDAIIPPENSSSNVLDVLGLVLGALIKMITLTPGVFTRFIGVIISSLLRLCAYDDYDALFFPKQMLALQCLESIAKAPLPQSTKIRDKDEVVAALSAAVDHPSVIMRQAVIHVRHCWYSL